MRSVQKPRIELYADFLLYLWYVQYQRLGEISLFLIDTNGMWQYGIHHDFFAVKKQFSLGLWSHKKGECHEANMMNEFKLFFCDQEYHKRNKCNQIVFVNSLEDFNQNQ